LLLPWFFLTTKKATLKATDMKPFPFFTLLLLFPAFTLMAQDPSPIPDKPGTWNYAYLNDENTKMYAQQFGMTPAEITVFRQKLDHIVNVLHQTPVMADPKGIDPAVESRPLYPHGFKDHVQNYGYIGEINFRLCPWFNSKGKIYKQTIEPPRVSLYINQIIPLKRSAFNVGGPEGPDIKKAENLTNEICKPDRIRELGPGVTLYDAAIVVGDPGKTLYLPCSVEEAYKRLLAFYELAAKKEPAFGVILDGIRQEKAGLTADQLKKPAYFGGMFSGITSLPNDAPLFLFNNNYFDRSKPKTAVQLIIFPIDADYFRKESGFVPNDVGFVRINQFLHSLDPAALFKLLD
jgi:hypothetical protein